MNKFSMRSFLVGAALAGTLTLGGLALAQGGGTTGGGGMMSMMSQMQEQGGEAMTAPPRPEHAS